MSHQITRGTTPTIELVVKQDLTDYECYLAFGRYKNPTLILDNSQMELLVDDDGTSHLLYSLTEDQTLKFKKGQTNMQLRLIKDKQGFATELFQVEVCDVIDERDLIDDLPPTY